VFGLWPYLKPRQRRPELPWPQWTTKVVHTPARSYAIIDEGSSPSTILLLHGNPTSKEQWRHFIAPLSVDHRVIAPDLFDPNEPPNLVTAATHLAGLLDVLGVTRVTVVGHDWGVALLAELLGQRPELVTQAVFFEGLLFPLSLRHHHWVPWLLCRFFGLPGIGELFFVWGNLFVDLLTPLGHRLVIDKALREHHRRCYASTAMRRHALAWLRQVPTSRGHQNHDRIDDNRRLLLSHPMRKLTFFVEPGFASNRAARVQVQNEAKALTSVDLGDGLHFIDDDHRDTMLVHLQRWLGGVSA
jgi:haloalkane dehalogenase